MTTRHHYILLLAFSILFASCTKKIHLVKSDPRYYVVNQESNAQSSDALNSLLSPYQEMYAKTMNDVIGEAGVTLKKGKPESTLGNWISDLLLDKANQYAGVPVDIAIQNYGGIRIPELAKGDITRAKVYELMPFDNMLVIVVCPGEKLQLYLNNIAASGGIPASSTLQMKIKDGKPTDVRIGGKPFDPNATYNIALPDYVANGGDRADFLVDLQRFDTGKFIRDMILESVEEHKGPIQVKLDGRITKE